MGQSVFLTAGSMGFFGGSKAQCVDQGRPLLDPAAQHRDLVGRQMLATLLGRHAQFRIVALDPLDKVAFIGLARARSPAPALKLGERAFLGVEPQAGFPARSSGPWQAKQLSERIGRTSRAKFTGRDLASPAAGIASPSPCAAAAIPRAKITNAFRIQIAMPFPLASASFRPRLARRPESSGRRSEIRANVRWSNVFCV